MVRLVIGLGNPRAEYQLTRHSVGREFIDFLAEHEKLSFKKNRQAELIRLPIFIGAKLQCFMNESGVPIKKLMEDENAKPDQILVIVDDFMIPFGTLRLRPGGSSGGHNGIKSIIEQLGTEEFPRLRVGVGPVPRGEDPADFVLERFTKTEQKKLPQLYQAMHSGIATLIDHGFQKAMSLVNHDHLA